MSLLDILSDHGAWEKFCVYKTSECLSKPDEKELRAFIDEKRYLPVCELIAKGERFPLPRRSVISKLGSEKKRVVYTYPKDENTVMKLLTYLLTRRYDGLFSPGLYSFRQQKTAKEAVRGFMKLPGIETMYSYKVDIHDYFNSVPVDRLLPMLEDVISDDPRLLSFLESLLCEEYVLDHGAPVKERKGIMAGTPVSAFYANLYLCGLDRHFDNSKVPYARYSDDIIVFAKTKEETERHAGFIREYLNGYGLTVNPSKEQFSSPSDGWTFLGFYVNGKTADIAAATVKKLKQKMRRKSNALRRWAKRNDVEGEKAAKAFIRIFNRKLLESPEDNELSWSRWFFPVINTVKSLKTIDCYAQQCVRYLISGTHTKAAYRVKYEDMKAIGYKNLVHEFYAFNENSADNKNN